MAKRFGFHLDGSEAEIRMAIGVEVTAANQRDPATDRLLVDRGPGQIRVITRPADGRGVEVAYDLEMADEAGREFTSRRHLADLLEKDSLRESRPPLAPLDRSQHQLPPLGHYRERVVSDTRQGCFVTITPDENAPAPPDAYGRHMRRLNLRMRAERTAVEAREEVSL